MATIQDSISKIWVEDFAPGVRDLLVEQDNTFKEVIDSNTGVISENMGRDWKVKHTFITSVAGRIRTSSMAPDALYGSGVATDPVHRVNAASLNTYPGMSGYPMVGYTQRTVELTKWKGNVFMPFYLMRADKTDSTIAEAVSINLKQSARGVAMIKAANFFATDANKSLVTVGAITGSGNGEDGDGGTSAIGVKFTIAEGDSIARIAPGLEVDIHLPTSAYTVKNTTSAMIIKSVDPLNREVIAVHADAAGPFNAAVAVGDAVVLRSSRAGGPHGLEYWLTDTGTIFDMALASFPQLKSKVTAVDGNLTDLVLTNNVGAFIDAYGPSIAPDTLLTRSGVIAAYVGEVDSMWQFGVQGQPVRRAGGFNILPFDYNGHTMSWKTSRIVGTGRLYGIRLKNNIKRYVPPRLPQAGTNGYFNSDFEFIAPLGGANGIWMPVLTGDGEVTEWVQAPYECCEQYCPEVVQGIKLTGLTEWQSA